MDNPFDYRGPVSDARFCGREPELAFGENLLEAGEGPLLVGSSGWGVTSFVRELLERLDPELGIERRDLWPTVSRERLLSKIREVLNEPGQGTSAASSRSVLVMEGLESVPAEWWGDVLQVFADADAGPGIPGVLTVGPSFPPDAVPPRGEEEKEPGGDARRIDLGPIPFEAWLPFVLERFLETRRWIANEHVEETVRRTAGHPRYTQQLLHHVWSRCEPGGSVSEAHVDRAFRLLLDEESRRFEALWRELTLNQRRVLWGLARERPDVGPFSSRFVREHHLASPSSAQRALQGLAARRLVSDAGETREITDPVLSAWIRARDASATRRATSE